MATDNITVKAPRDLIEQLRALAAEHHRSLAGELATALEQYIERERPAS